MIKGLLAKLKANAERRCVLNGKCPLCKGRFIVGEDGDWLCRRCDLSFSRREVF